jgi:2-polyprenyl-6-methoxyphenol hydroxylase-like FAD-dependent oxidoreductase
MPPQGESIGIALEDVVLLSRILEKSKSEKPIQIFEEYDRIRRASVEKAYEAANWGWEKVKDKGFIAGIMMEWLTGIFLWWTKKSKEEELAFDVRDIALDA